MESRVVGMMGLEVTTEVIGAGKLTRASVTHERLVAGVQSGVTTEVSQPREHLTTLGTHERFLRSCAGVRTTQVLPELCRIRKDFLTFSTLKHTQAG